MIFTFNLNKKEFSMRKIVSKFALAAGIVLAMAFTFSCDSGGGGGGGNNPGGGGKGDLQKWTAVKDSKFGSSIITAIAYGNNRFIAGSGEDGKMAYSSDGISWTAVANSPFNSIEDIAYGGGRWVALGNGIAYSDDNGVSWTAVSGSGLPNFDIAYGNNRWVGVGSRGSGIAYSDDGINWTAVADSTIWVYTHTFPNGTSYTGTVAVTDIAYGNSRWVAVGAEGGKMAYSDDNGVTWTAVTDSTLFANGIGDIAFGNNRFVAVIGRRIAYSDNGISWTAVTNSPFSTDIKGIAYGNNRFVAVDGIGTIAYSEDNGVTWTAVEDSKMSFPFGIAYGNNRFVAVGFGEMAYADW
jgi:hypothetical protein